MATSWVQRSCDFYAARVKVYTHEWQIHGEKERGRGIKKRLSTRSIPYIYIHTHIRSCRVVRVRRVEEVEGEDRRDLTHPGLCALA